MATTPVYNWPTPDDTDLVRDGAEAIRDLGNAIDTTVSTLPTGAYTELATGALSGTTFNITSIPSGYFEIVLIVESFTNTASAFTTLRVNNLSTAIYYHGEIDNSNSTVASAPTTGIGNFNPDSSNASNMIVRLQNYDTATTTGRRFHQTTMAQYNNLLQTWIGGIGTGPITEINISCASGTMAGNYRLYGVK